MREFLELFLGKLPFYEWVYLYILIGMGAFMYAFLRVKKRKDKGTKATFKGWVEIDKYRNAKAVLFSVILTYISIRFYSEYEEALLKIIPEGFKLTRYFAMIVVGFGMHKISEWLAKLANRE